MQNLSHKRAERQPQSSEHCHRAGKQLLRELWVHEDKKRQQMTKRKQLTTKTHAKTGRASEVRQAVK